MEVAMTKRYSSFFIRYWRLENGERRLQVEHTQSGERTRTDSLAEAVAWLEVHESGSTADLQQMASRDEQVLPKDGIAIKHIDTRPHGRQPGDVPHTDVEDT
jgi:hypothetical protein